MFDSWIFLGLYLLLVAAIGATSTKSHDSDDDDEEHGTDSYTNVSSVGGAVVAYDDGSRLLWLHLARLLRQSDVHLDP